MAALGVGGLVARGANTASSARVSAVTRQLQWDIPVGSSAQASACNRLMPGRAGLVRGVAGNDFCYLAHEGQPDVALIGDSMNLSLFPGLSHYGDINVLLASASEAAPFFDTTTTEHFDKTRLNNWRLTNQALDYALASPSIRVVVLSYANGDQLLNPASAHRITDRADASPAPPFAVVERALRRTLARLSAAGKRVILIAPNQRMGFDPGECLTDLRPVHGASYRHPCAEPLGGVLAQRRLAYDALLRRVAGDYPGVTTLDLARPLCDGALCYAMRGGRMLYRDTLHLSDEGSAQVAPALHGAILARFTAAP